MANLISHHVLAQVTRAEQAPQGGRLATCVASRAVLEAKLGEPSWRISDGELQGVAAVDAWRVGDPPLLRMPDGKITVSWYFMTPRGAAEVRDYWWNGPNEWSIAAVSAPAARWLCKWLRLHGLPAGYQTKEYLQ